MAKYGKKRADKFIKSLDSSSSINFEDIAKRLKSKPRLKESRRLYRKIVKNGLKISETKEHKELKRIKESNLNLKLYILLEQMIEIFHLLNYMLSIKNELKVADL